MQDKKSGSLFTINMDMQVYDSLKESTIWEHLKPNLPATIIEAHTQRQRIRQVQIKIQDIAQRYNAVECPYGYILKNNDTTNICVVTMRV